MRLLDQEWHIVRNEEEVLAYEKHILGVAYGRMKDANHDQYGNWVNYSAPFGKTYQTVPRFPFLVRSFLETGRDNYPDEFTHIYVMPSEALELLAATCASEEEWWGVKTLEQRVMSHEPWYYADESDTSELDKYKPVPAWRSEPGSQPESSRRKALG